MFGTENAMANDVPAEFLSLPQTEKPKVEPQNVDRYFSLFILFINSHNMVRNDGKLSFNHQITVPSFFFTMSPLNSPMSPLFQALRDIVPGFEISRQTANLHLLPRMFVMFGLH